MKNFIVALVMVLMTSTGAMAADDAITAITNKRIIDAAPALFSENKAVLMGITDDASQYLKLLRSTDGGYIITSNLPSENLFLNEDTATSQNLLTSGGFLLRLIIGVADAGTTVEFYDEADATCDANKIATIDTSAVASIALGLKTTNGLCLKTIGHDTGNVTVVYK